jgi:hypothetical protein
VYRANPGREVPTLWPAVPVLGSSVQNIKIVYSI